MNRKMIEDLITKHEGYKSRVYFDSKGNPSIGIGWNLNSAGSDVLCHLLGVSLDDLKSGRVYLSDGLIDKAFDYQLGAALLSAAHLFPGFMSMPDVVQAVIADMIFNMGYPRFATFRDMIAALNSGDWKRAAVAAGDSLWAEQVPSRAKDDIHILNAA